VDESTVHHPKTLPLHSKDAKGWILKEGFLVSTNTSANAKIKYSVVIAINTNIYSI
jgi:hypothetical protein